VLGSLRAMTADGSLQVRPFRPDEWAVLRDVRLAALQDAPDAFYSTYEDTKDRPEASWRAWPSRGVAMGAWVDEKPVGMVGVATTEEAPAEADLFAMWVAPTACGSGAADLLVRRAVDWAAEQGCTSVSLEVAPGNQRAERVYARHGFVLTGAAATVACGHAMRRDLGPPFADS
jgi:RimJ/RimL family protein N-acetyltransferase